MRDEPEIGILYLVGTPIGNISDLSPRAQSILENVSIIACEDTRHSGILLNRLKIKASLISFHKYNCKKRVPEILEHLANNQTIALISDAGLPTISDPGEALVSATRDSGYDVVCIPGPCAALTALIASGLPAERFCFEGFLPRKTRARKLALDHIVKETRTSILYESPHRLLKLLEELSERCEGTRPLYVARELTKKHEQHIGPNLNSVINHFRKSAPKGELTLVLGGAKPEKKIKINNDELIKELSNLISQGIPPSMAAKQLSKITGISKNLLYSLIHKEQNI